MAAPPARRSARIILKDLENRDWSTLPVELLEFIGQMLPSRRQAVRFRTVCPAWRAALPFAKYVAPVLMLPVPNSPDGTVNFYTPGDGGESTFTRNLPTLRGKRLCGSSGGWLALVDEGGPVTLLNPLTGASVGLPPPDEHVVGASFRNVTEQNGIPMAMLLSEYGQYTYVRLDEMRNRVFRQIVLSSSSPASGDCVAMASLADSGTVAFCRVGVDAAWTLLETNLPVGPVTSVVHFHGSTFLAIADGGIAGGPAGGISMCDVGGVVPTATRVQGLHGAPKLMAYTRTYLQVNGKLYMVATVIPQQGSAAAPLSHHVYRCNIMAVKPRWTRVINTHGLTLFMSTNLTDFTAGYGGAASVSGFINNSVYRAKPNNQRDGLELEIIDIDNGTSQVLQPYHEEIQGSGPLCWIQPNHWA